MSSRGGREGGNILSGDESQAVRTPHKISHKTGSREAQVSFGRRRFSVRQARHMKNKPIFGFDSSFKDKVESGLFSLAL